MNETSEHSQEYSEEEKLQLIEKLEGELDFVSRGWDHGDIEDAEQGKEWKEKEDAIRKELYELYTPEKQLEMLDKEIRAGKRFYKKNRVDVDVIMQGAFGHIPENNTLAPIVKERVDKIREKGV
jgi:hypothetical protein